MLLFYKSFTRSSLRPTASLICGKITATLLLRDIRCIRSWCTSLKSDLPVLPSYRVVLYGKHVETAAINSSSVWRESLFYVPEALKVLYYSSLIYHTSQTHQREEKSRFFSGIKGSMKIILTSMDPLKRVLLDFLHTKNKWFFHWKVLWGSKNGSMASLR